MKENKDKQYAKEYVCNKFGDGIAIYEANEEIVCGGFEVKE
jgi:hypothetical protein